MMYHYVYIAVFLCLSVLSVESKTVSGLITVEVDLSGQASSESVELWLPYPVSDKHQDISDITIQGNNASTAVYTDKVFQMPMLHAKWPSGASERTLTFRFKATRQELTRPEFSSQDIAWNPADYALELKETPLAPLNQDIVALARSITKDCQSSLEKARAIYDWTVENTYRNPETVGCGAGDICTLLKDPGGKCTDISSIFIALARASGVPAREVLGIRMGKKPVQDITGWQHCWAEFFLPGTGWVSVDPADVRKKMLVENLELNSPEIAASREYFFGGIDAYRIKLGQGRHIKLNPAAKGGAINYLMYPFAQVDGKTLDWLSPDTFSYSIRYEEIPISGE